MRDGYAFMLVEVLHKNISVDNRSTAMF